MEYMKHIHVDMDGVLCDFDGGMVRAVKKICSLSKTEVSQSPDADILHNIRAIVKSSGIPPQQWGVKEYHEYIPISQIRPILKATIPHGFFRTLPPLQSGIEAVQALKDKYPYATIGVLSCVGKMSPAIATEHKLQWLEQHVPHMFNKAPNFTHRGKDKAFYAEKGHLLIDDHVGNTDAFVAAGGSAILHK